MASRTSDALQRQRNAKPISRGAVRAKRKAPTRKIGSAHSPTRAELLDAAEALMRTEGYAAVTSRKVANAAHITPQLVHYYFHTMDDLFLALWQRFVAKNLERQARDLESTAPLRALWDFSRKYADSSLETEFLALAHHRKSIRDEIARDGERFRRIQFELLSRKLANYQLDDGGATPKTLVVLLTSLARSLIMEKDLGMSAGHRETLQYVERWINSMERQAPQSTP